MQKIMVVVGAEKPAQVWSCSSSQRWLIWLSLIGFPFALIVLFYCFLSLITAAFHVQETVKCKIDLLFETHQSLTYISHVHVYVYMVSYIEFLEVCLIMLVGWKTIVTKNVHLDQKLCPYAKCYLSSLAKICTGIRLFEPSFALCIAQ